MELALADALGGFARLVLGIVTKGLIGTPERPPRPARPPSHPLLRAQGPLPIRMPTQWAPAQAAFRRSYLATGVPDALRTPCLWRWWRRGRAERTTVGVYDEHASDGTKPLVVFDIDVGRFPGHGGGPFHGVVVGELTLNGALVLESDQGVVWPVYNPVLFDHRARGL